MQGSVNSNTYDEVDGRAIVYAYGRKHMLALWDNINMLKKHVTYQI